MKPSRGGGMGYGDLGGARLDIGGDGFAIGQEDLDGGHAPQGVGQDPGRGERGVEPEHAARGAGRADDRGDDRGGLSLDGLGHSGRAPPAAGDAALGDAPTQGQAHETAARLSATKAVRSVISMPPGKVRRASIP